ncbi:MAG: YccF domain-containing protein [Bacillales bacterium]|nr:YccF domain-containing protein [Bacillales bacterium]
MKKAFAIIGNIIWIVFGGLIWSIVLDIFGVVLMISLIGIPCGLQLFKMSGFVLWPFGKVVKTTKTNGFKIFLNVLWAIFFGWEFALSFAITGCVFFITIIGIPFSKIYFRLASFIIFPLGRSFAKKDASNKVAESKEKTNSQGDAALIESKDNSSDYANCSIEEFCKKLDEKYDSLLIEKLRSSKEKLDLGLIKEEEYNLEREKVKNEFYEKKDEEYKSFINNVYLDTVNQLKDIFDNPKKYDENRVSFLLNKLKELTSYCETINDDLVLFKDMKDNYSELQRYKEIQKNIEKALSKGYSVMEKSQFDNLINELAKGNEKFDFSNCIEEYKARYALMEEKVKKNKKQIIIIASVVGGVLITAGVVIVLLALFL